MILKKWNELPDFMRCDEVRPYYKILHKKRFQLALKRMFDLLMASVMIVFFAIPMVVVAIMIKVDSNGAVFFRQERVTTYGKVFRIHKFRTMVTDAENLGSSVTVKGDARITKIGKILRKYRIDEIPQLIDVLMGTMSYVGTRPEMPKYVKQYSKEMYATLLMPAGITSEASIRYKDESRLLDGADDIDEVYVRQVLPQKMKWNLESVRRFKFLREILTMFRTVVAILGKDYK